MQKFIQKKYLILIIVLVSIFFLSIAVRYYPVFHKGYSYGLNTTNLILARNLSLTGEYKIVDGKDIVLSSSLIKERGLISDEGNKLTSVIYAKLFDIFGFKPNFPLYVSLFLYALTTVLLFLLVFKLFNFKIALIFAGVDIFIPFVLGWSIVAGFYEWAMLFFVIGLYIYLYKEKPGIWRLLLSSLFFAVAALARNAFLISFIPFIVYDWYTNFIYKKDWRKFKLWLWPAIKRVFIFALPVILLWGGFMIQDYLGGRVNQYLSRGDTGYDGHLFRDPYTYHFDKENYIKEIWNKANGETITNFPSYGYHISFKQRLSIYSYSIKYYLNGFFRQPTLGGPIILFFLFFGGFYLFKLKRNLLIFSVFWIGILFFILIAMGTSNVDHVLEIRFPLILLISVGIYGLLSWLRQVIPANKSYYLIALAIIVVLGLHLIQSDKWLFHENYLYSRVEEKMYLLNLVNKKDLNIGRNDVIAISGGSLFFNYYTDYNYIDFNPETIKKLLKENKLQWAFDQFGVTKIVGYSDALSQEIIQSTDVKSIVGLSPGD